MKYHIEFDLDFKRNPYKGLYIALEGIDGCGKTTQLEKIAEYFESKRKKVIRTREPRKTEGIIGRLIARILKGRIKVPNVALQYLFTADRAMHYEELILPSLKAGYVVISDRCFWSAVPYGILDRMIDHQKGRYDYNMGEVILTAQSILSMYHQFVVPDMTFYLHISPDTGIARTNRKNEENELYETREKLDKIILGYNWLMKNFPKEMVKIDGEKTFEEVTKEILGHLHNARHPK